MAEHLTFDLNEEFDTFTSESQIKEATAFKTVLKGTYTVQIDRFEPRINPLDAAYAPGRRYVRFGASILACTKSDVAPVGPARGLVFFNATWQAMKKENRNGELALDLPSKLWGQLVKAVDATVHTNIPGVVELAEKYQLSMFLSESFRAPDGTYQDYTTVEERQSLIDAGFEPGNMVFTISKVR